MSQPNTDVPEDRPTAGHPSGDNFSRREFLQAGSLSVAGGMAAALWARGGSLVKAADWLQQEMAQPVDPALLAVAVPIFAGDNIQAVVDANPENTFFLLKATNRAGNRAVHRMQQVVPKNGQQFIGERDGNGRLITVMSGAAILPATGWQKEGSLYRYDHPPIQTGHRTIVGQARGDTWRPPIAWPEDLFVTTRGKCVPLTRVKSREEIVAGKTWYMDEDHRAELLQGFTDANGRPAMYLYDWQNGQLAYKGDDSLAGDPGDTSGIMAHLVGDVDGDGSAEIVQLRNAGGRLRIVVYNWYYDTFLRNGPGVTSNDSSRLVSRRLADVDGDGRAELLVVIARLIPAIVPYWKQYLCLYGWQDGELRKRGEIDMGLRQPSHAWLAADVNDDGQDEFIRVDESVGRVRTTIYRWSNGQMTEMARNLHDTLATIPHTLNWLTGDIDGDGRTEIVQAWNHNNRLALCVYAHEEWERDLSKLNNWPRDYHDYRRVNRMVLRWSGDLPAGSGRLALLMGDVDGDGRAELIQPWNNTDVGRLAVAVHGWVDGHFEPNDSWTKPTSWEPGYMTMKSSADTNQGAGALAWRLADVDGDDRAELIQPWNNNGKVSLLVYRYQDNQMVVLGSSHTDQPVAAVEWQTGDLDYGAARRIYMADNPYGVNKLVELSVSKFAFGYNVTRPGRYLPDWDLDTDPLGPHPNIYAADYPYRDKPANVMIRHLIIEKYANPAQTGAIGYFRPGNDWIIVNNEVRLNHASGIKFKGAAVVRGNHTHHNGQFGFECGDGNRNLAGSCGPHPEGHVGLEEWGFNGGFAGAGAVVENNVNEYNNRLRFHSGWGAGGSKFSQCYDLMVRNNLVRGNDGPALWCDFAYANIHYEDNVIVANQGEGIFHELSYNARITNNTLIDNGLSRPDNYGSQIFVSASSNVEVDHNYIYSGIPPDGSGNSEGKSDMHAIMVVQTAFRPELTRTIEEWPAGCRNVIVHGNTVVHVPSTGLSGAQMGYDNPEGPNFFAPGNIVFRDNHYHCLNPETAVHWRWNGAYVNFTTFKAAHAAEGSVDAMMAAVVMAAGVDQYLYRYMPGGQFNLVPGLGVGVDGGFAGNALVVNSAGRVYWSKSFGLWREIYGCVAADAAMSFDAVALYAVGKDGRLYWYEWSGANAGRFVATTTPAPLSRVAMDNNYKPWVVAQDGRVFTYHLVNGWLPIPGCVAQDVGCGCGKVYACGRNHKLYQYNPILERFEQTNSSATRVSVDVNGVLWIVNRAGTIYRRKPAPDETGVWEKIDGCIAQDVGA